MDTTTEADRYADMGSSVANTPTALIEHLFRKMMEKTSNERLIVGCQMADSAR